MHVLFNMSAKVQRMLPDQTFRQFGIASLKRFNDVHVVDNGPAGPVIFGDRFCPDRPHVNEQIISRINKQGAIAHPKYRLVERNVAG